MADLCSIDGCERPRYGRGWCSLHYTRWSKSGDPLAVKVIRGQPLVRFLAKMDRTDTCWLWTAARDGCGYGLFRSGPKVYRSHRWAYEHFVGPIPAGLELDHLCRNRACCNPSHLEPVSHRVNVLRGESRSAGNALKTHCPEGHPYDDANTYRFGGGRYCRACCNRRKAARNRLAQMEKAS